MPATLRRWRQAAYPADEQIGPEQRGTGKDHQPEPPTGPFCGGIDPGRAAAEDKEQRESQPDAEVGAEGEENGFNRVHRVSKMAHFPFLATRPGQFASALARLAAWFLSKSARAPLSYCRSSRPSTISKASTLIGAV